MRQIVVDTETTGLQLSEGHRVIEIGCVELVNRRLTRRHFHHYVRPDREVDEGAMQVHGITNEFLSDKPPFGEIANEFLEFVRGGELVIHNAAFDVGFLDHELKLALGTWDGLQSRCSVLDTLELARDLHPGQKNTLDALCRRYGVDNSRRELHGALLDAEILADVYLAMTGGQAMLALGALPAAGKSGGAARLAADRPALTVIEPGPEELAAHSARLEAIEAASGAQCAWRELMLDDEPAT